MLRTAAMLGGLCMLYAAFAQQVGTSEKQGLMVLVALAALGTAARLGGVSGAFVALPGWLAAMFKQGGAAVHSALTLVRAALAPRDVLRPTLVRAGKVSGLALLPPGAILVHEDSDGALVHLLEDAAERRA